MPLRDASEEEELANEKRLERLAKLRGESSHCHIHKNQLTLQERVERLEHFLKHATLDLNAKSFDMEYTEHDAVYGNWIQWED